MDKNFTSIRLQKNSNNIVKNIDNSLGKLPPQALELEENILGALMLEKDALSEIMDILYPDCFYNNDHKEIFKAIVDLFTATKPVDMRTVVHQLRKNGKLEFIGGSYRIAELTQKVTSAANIEEHARIITELAIKRELIRVGTKIHNQAYEDTTDVFNLLDQTQSDLFDISESNIRKNFDMMNTLMKKAIVEIERRKNHKDGLTGVASGFSDLDRMTSGWQNSDLIIIAARPGMGKTAFVVSALRNTAVKFKQPVAIFSLEMSSIQLVNRLISIETELESEKIKKGLLMEDEWEQLVNKTVELGEAPIFIDDSPALQILELRAKCRRLKAQHNVGLIVIDYLQLMSGDGSKNKGNREQEIASISRSLKGIAKELNVPVIALSQLSRAVDTRGGDKRPQLSDLRESGSIEQDADMVMFLFRPEYYNLTEDETGMPTKGVAELIIAKHRNGSLGTVKLNFIDKYTKFTDMDYKKYTSNDGYNSIRLGSKMNGKDDIPFN